MVALVFWAVGVGVLTFRTPDRTASLFFILSQAGSITLAAGATSLFGYGFPSAVFNISLWMIGPLMVHFHLYFPKPTLKLGQYKLLWMNYGLAIFGSLLYILWDRNFLPFTWANQLRVTGQLFFAVNMLIVVALLVYSYRTAVTADTRGKIRLVNLGGLVGLLPLATLTILPNVLFNQPILPWEYAFLILSVIPLTYAYAIIRHRLIEIEKHVNRGANSGLGLLFNREFLPFPQLSDTKGPATAFPRSINYKYLDRSFPCKYLFTIETSSTDIC